MESPAVNMGHLNTCVFQKSTDMAKASENHMKRTVTNVMAKHSELFKFKSKVSEILHKAKGVSNKKEEEIDEADDKRNESIEDNMINNMDEATEKASGMGRHRMSEKICEQSDVQEDEMEECGVGERAEDNSNTMVNSGSASSKQRRLSYNDLSIHEEFNKDDEDTEAVNKKSLNWQSDNFKTPNITGKRDGNSRPKKSSHLISDEVDSCEQPDSSEEESPKRKGEIPEKLATKSVKGSTITGKALSLSSKIIKVRKHIDSGKSFIPWDDLCSFNCLIRKHAVVKKCVYPRSAFGTSDIAIGMFSFFYSFFICTFI
jgi:hypothetical protein